MTPVIGLVDRGGKLITKMLDNVIVLWVREFILLNSSTRGTTLLTDESLLYQFVYRYMKHKSVNHKVHYVDGEVDTNTLEAS